MIAVKRYSFAILFFFTVVGCSYITDFAFEPSELKIDPTPDIVKKSNQIVISLVGEKFFNEHYFFDPFRSRYYEADPWCIQHPSDCLRFLQKPHYLMVYSFRTNGITTEALSAEFVVDTSGNLITERDISGVPNCVNDPKECVFIDKASAISIAKSAGLETGIEEWKISFHWFAGNSKTFVWTVSNTLRKASGKVVVIDANSGTVIGIYDWFTIG
jgi:hypothetical protein